MDDLNTGHGSRSCIDYGFSQVEFIPRRLVDWTGMNDMFFQKLFTERHHHS
jgi:hypothetical protein